MSEKTRLNAEHGYFCIEFLDLIEMRDQVYLVIAKSKYFNLHCAKTPNLEKGALCTDQEELVSVGNDKKMLTSQLARRGIMIIIPGCYLDQIVVNFLRFVSHD